jgi:hypothetical protein
VSTSLQPENQATTASSSNFWSERRAWWQAEKARSGTDWPGVATTILQVDAFLRAASS